MQGVSKITPYYRNRYIDNAGKYWHEFYKRNSDHFYKDRHYLHIVFPELSPEYYSEINLESNKFCGPDASIHLLEVGSGVG